MQIVNRTPFPARLLTLEREEGQVQAVVVVKATYERGADGGLVPAAEQVPVVADKLETSFGVFHTDHYVRKECADVCVLGTVRRAKPVTEARLALRIGSHGSEITVFGDRRWMRDGKDLVPSPPAPFTEMPLSYSRAYGGKAEYNHEMVTWADNPEGRGYYCTREQAEGQPLPNIELTRGPRIRAWSDQAPVAGWGPYPMFWGLRAREGIEVRGSADSLDLPRLSPRLNNHAHPDLIVPSIEAGDAIRIEGLRDREVRVVVPPDGVSIEARIGETVLRAKGEIDGVFLWADTDRVTVTHRLHFAYPFRREEIRQAHLRMEPDRSGAGGATDARSGV